MSLPFASIISSLPTEDASWGPPTSAPTGEPAILDDVPYAPYSKGDKLYKMADWSTEGGKDGRDQRGGRQFNRLLRGISLIKCFRE